MNERNHPILQAAIRKLPEHSAPPEIWDKIEDQLRIDRQDLLIRSGIQKLPDYSAPVNTWDKIQAQLPPKPVRPLWLRSGKALRRIAAIGVILAGLAWLWTSRNAAPQAVYSSYQEKADPYLQQEDWDADEAAFSEVLQRFEQHQRVFQNPQNEALRREFQVLEADRRELKEAINTYGKSPELIRQLAGLERSRTKIIKEMAEKI